MDHVFLCSLLDAYGELLTEKQRSIVEQSVCEDYSLSEIAEREGISRQGVRDTLKRAVEQLVRYETLLGVVAKGEKLANTVGEIAKLIEKSDMSAGVRENILALLGGLTGGSEE